jgi:uncharacterized protein DUF669
MVDVEIKTTLDVPFEPEKEEGTSARNLIPPGKYKAEIVDASVAPMKNGKGSLLSLSWQITDEGEWQARYVFQTIVLTHTESKDAEIWGRRKVKDLCDACAIREAVTDVSVFQYKPCMIQVGVERDRSGQYPDKNRVISIKPLVVVNAPLQQAKGTTGNSGATPDINDEIPW